MADGCSYLGKFECSVCQGVENHTDFCVLSCGHPFHVLCVETWLERSATCPSCRVRGCAHTQQQHLQEPAAGCAVSSSRSCQAGMEAAAGITMRGSSHRSNCSGRMVAEVACATAAGKGDEAQHPASRWCGVCA
ncbi:hypothetical protein COO60DRAFT_1022029 [Scenedesmus sp. NREL 46B-D3]|nr:hypothetical protein COO60DRAFT_1022029 [Scenedesmus sp. NREL 46B-D3]